MSIGLEVGVGQEWDGQGKVALGRCEVARIQCLVDEVNSSTASRFFKTGGHTTYAA